MQISNYQSQILVGTILGGSSLVFPKNGVNCHLLMRDSNETWLKYKLLQMPDYFKEIRINKYSNTYRCTSLCSEKLTEMKEVFYSGKSRIIAMDILDQLKDTGIAVWFLDSGSKTGRERKNAYLNTTRFGEEGTQTICQYFNEVGMDCRINKESHRKKVVFTVEGTEKLLKTIAPEFPEFMYYRL